MSLHETVPRNFSTKLIVPARNSIRSNAFEGQSEDQTKLESYTINFAQAVYMEVNIAVYRIRAGTVDSSDWKITTHETSSHLKYIVHSDSQKIELLSILPSQISSKSAIAANLHHHVIIHYRRRILLEHRSHADYSLRIVGSSRSLISLLDKARSTTCSVWRNSLVFLSIL